MNLDLQQPTAVWTNAFGYDLPREIMWAVDLRVPVIFMYAPIVYLTGRAKRLSSVISPAGSFAYGLSAHQPSTLIHQLALPNTSYITNAFDSVARLTSTALKNSSHSTLNSHQYTYNRGNQRTQQVFSTGSTYSYAYDSIGQLKVADSGTASEDRGYTYDTAWNLNYRTNNGTLNTFSVDGLNQLTSAPSGACSYDGNGNLISSSGGLLELTYDSPHEMPDVRHVWQSRWSEESGVAGTPVSTYLTGQENRLSLVRSNLVV